jgi:HEAT repeat protein
LRHRALTLLGVLALLTGSTPLWASPPLRAAMADLHSCHDIDAAFCRDLPARLSAHGGAAVSPITRALPKLPQAAQIIAIAALVSIEDKAATRGLAELSIKAPTPIRRLVIPALAKRQGPLVVSTLLRCLRDTKPFIRSLCAEVLVIATPKRQSARVAKALIRGTRDAVLSVRVTCIESLGYLGQKLAVRTLLGKLGNGSPPEQAATLLAFRFLPDRRAIEPCMTLMEWADPILSNTIGETLEALTGRRFGASYPHWKAWWDKKKEPAR